MVHLFGIRHHGPGSARSLLAALQNLSPDIVLIEGPPDAENVLPLLAEAGMEPPLALLIYALDDPKKAVYYPFAVFSPEWQALRYAQTQNVPVRFMDLPQTHRFAALQEAETRAKREAEQSPEVISVEPTEADIPAAAATVPKEEPEVTLRGDPLGAIARAAGYDDGEDWWEQVIEHRGDAADQFASVAEIMGEVRADLPPDPSVEEQQREAWMRRAIRAAQKEGFQKIAVVCGAFHTPALQNVGDKDDKTRAKEDEALLKGLGRVPVAATWVPWTFGRLTFAGGYGAGVRSPAWYQRLWDCPEKVPVRWLSDVAVLLRGEGLLASTASVIEAVRLADTLAALRDLPAPALPELRESALAILCNGQDTPMALIESRLIVGERLGKVSDKTPMLPLQRDLRAEQKRLRLEPSADFKDITLDLRQENDLAKSHLFHRLNLMGIKWATLQQVAGKGTFKEGWRLQWQPEFEVLLIEANIWGRTVRDAANGLVHDRAAKAADLPVLTELVEHTLQADLSTALEDLLARVENLAAVSSDVLHLMDALPPLANVTRYGNVRQTDTAIVGRVVNSLLVRICAGLPPACASLNDDAAAEMYPRIVRVHQAVGLLQEAEQTAQWEGTLARLADREGMHGLIAGACCRLLLDRGVWDTGEISRRLSVALSQAADPPQAAAWLEGMLRDSGEILLHTETLWRITDEWLCGVSEENFVQLLPLLRRTFMTFAAPVRRSLGERVRTGASVGITRKKGTGIAPVSELDTERARRPLPLVAKLLGLTYEEKTV